MLRLSFSCGFGVLSLSRGVMPLVMLMASCAPEPSRQPMRLGDSGAVEQSVTESVHQDTRTAAVNEPGAVARPTRPDEVENKDAPGRPENDDAEPEQENEDSAVADPPEELPVNAASVVNSQFPSAMLCGEVTSVFIELLNTGTSTWTRENKYKLGTVDDTDPFYKTTRVWLPNDAVIPPNSPWVFEFELHAPKQEGVYKSDWQMVQEWVGWFGDIVAHDITVTCPPPPPWEYTNAIKNAVLDSATYVRNNFPQFFNLGELSKHDERVIAYKMMTTVINHLRDKGVDVSRCVANPELPQSNPIHWCSDALVVGPPGLGVTIDIYYSWSAPAKPHTSLTGTGSTGVVTDDLIALP